MSGLRAVARNVVWNWAGMGVTMAVGFLIAPFLVHHLGETAYGLWILIGSLTGYFGLLDLGVRGSVGRYIAFYQAKGDTQRANAIISSALAILTLTAAVVLAGMLAAIPLFFRLFEVPEAYAEQTRVALVLVGINLALMFPLSVFDATLWAMERFDVINAVDIAVSVTQAGLTFYWIGSGHGLVALAAIVTAMMVLGALAKAGITFWLDRSMRISVRCVTKEAAKSLYGYGFWYSLLNLSRVANTQMSPLIIGSWLSVAAVTPFSVARRLLTYASSAVVASTGVLTPMATKLHAEERHDRQQWLLVEGGKWCLAAGLFFLVYFLLLGEPLIRRWMGPSLSSAATLLYIVAAGELFAMAQCVSGNIVQAMARHRTLAVLSIIETVVGFGLAIALVGAWGLVGVCVGLAAATALFRGVLVAVYACRVTNVALGQYLRRAVLPPLGAAIVPAAALYAATRWRVPEGWAELILFTASFGLFYAMVCAPLLLGGEQLKALLARGRAVPQRVVAQS